MNQTEFIAELLRHAAKMQDAEHNHEHDLEHKHEHEHEESTNESSELITAKATAMCVLFVASTICGCIPFLLNRWFKWTENRENARSALIVKCLLYFGGGVLLCTTFMHLVPEVSENIEALQECGTLPELTFKLSHLLMCIGFFAMFFVEEMIHFYLHRHSKNADPAQKAFERGRSVRNSTLMKGRRGSNALQAKDNTLSQQDLITDDLESQKYKSEMPEESKKVEEHKKGGCDHGSYGHTHLPTSTGMDEDVIVSSLRGLLVVLALSLHELFEGLAVGLERSPGNVWYMFGAVSAHKLVLAFCVGVELIVTRTRLWLSVVYVITFAIVSPIGIGIGIYVSSDGNIASAIPSAILQGLATGTLLYVVFFEILSKDRCGFIAYFAFVIGFLVMYGLQFATTQHGHTHSHGCGGHSHEHDEDIEHQHQQLKLIQKATEEFSSSLSKKLH